MIADLLLAGAIGALTQNIFFFIILVVIALPFAKRDHLFSSALLKIVLLISGLSAIIALFRGGQGGSDDMEL